MNSQQPGRPDCQGVEPGFADEPGVRRKDGQQADSASRDGGAVRDAPGDAQAPGRDSRGDGTGTRRSRG